MAGKKRSRRSWPVAFKKRVVAEASQPGVSAAWIARQYDLNANLLFNWKKKYGVAANLIPVEIVPETSLTISSHKKPPARLTEPVSPDRFNLEIELPCGAQPRCGADIEPAAIGRALSALRGKQ